MPGQAAIKIDGNEWAVSLASTYAELTTGLSGVASLAPGTGMLFILPTDQPASVTTEPMRFNIDIIFISSDLEVVDVARNIAPGNIVTESTPVRYFLEVNAGEASGVESGDVVGITVYQQAGTLANWILPLVSIAGLIAVGAFMVSTVRSITRAVLGEPEERLEYLPQAEEITKEEQEFAEAMWESTKQLAEEKDPGGVHIWRMLEHYYPGNKSKQISTLGFMNEIHGRYGRGPIPHEELVKSAKKWGVEKMLVEEMVKFLPQLEGLERIGGKQPAVIPTSPTGTCYQDAWRYLLREQQGELIHGSIQTFDKRIKHAWVELPTGYIWEPESGQVMKKGYFYEIAQPQVQARYTMEEASIMGSRTGNFGPWTDEERERFLKKSPAVIPTEPELEPPYHLITEEGVKYMWQLERERERTPDKKLKPEAEAENRILYYLFRCGEVGYAPSKYEVEDILKGILGLSYIESRKRTPEILRGLQARGYIVKSAEEVKEFIRPQAQEFLAWITTASSQKQSAVIPTEPRPRRETDLEYLADSPEFLTQTIEAIGYRDKLDTTFQEAIKRAKGLK